MSEKKKIYMTPNGYDSLKNELHELVRQERPKLVEVVRWAASNGDRSENADYIYGKKRLREIDRRIRYITLRLEAAHIVDPRLQQDLKQIFFGAKVTLCDLSNKVEISVHIVGVDEADMMLNKISINAPLAKALIKKSVGDIVEYITPSGDKCMKIVSIEY